MNQNKMKEEQQKLADKVILTSQMDKINLIAGCYQLAVEDTIISSIAVIDFKTWEIIEMKYSIKKAALKYIPGFLSYREAPSINDTYHKLKSEPDIMFIHGNGILHPRKFGLASHMGLLLSKPTIGVAKKLLCGQLDGDTVYIGKDAVGKEVRIKENSNPIYVSPGHMISLKRSVELAKQFSKEPYKLPYPIAMAHKYAVKVKRKMQGKE